MGKCHVLWSVQVTGWYHGKGRELTHPLGKTINKYHPSYVNANFQILFFGQSGKEHIKKISGHWPCTWSLLICSNKKTMAQKLYKKTKGTVGLSPHWFAAIVQDPSSFCRSHSGQFTGGMMDRVTIHTFFCVFKDGTGWLCHWIWSEVLFYKKIINLRIFYMRSMILTDF